MDNIKAIMQTASVLGAGGAGFPSYAKLAEGVDTLLINGAECEPLLETDYILLRDELHQVLKGAEGVMTSANIGRTLLCIKKHNAIRLSFVEGQELAQNICVKILPDVYPMGDEINMIYEALGRVVAPGKLPLTVGVIVYNVETLYNVARALDGHPVTEKWVTIGGDILESLVVKVPVGMRVAELFENLAIKVPETHTLLDGGPSMGAVINPETAIIKKTTKGLLILPSDIPAITFKKGDLKIQINRASSLCCQCTRCTDLCPRGLLGYPLLPHKMVRTTGAIAEFSPEMVLSATLCCSCGICEVAACCQGISPKNIILAYKGILAKNKMRFTATEDVTADPARPYRQMPSERWESLLGVHRFARHAKRVEVNAPKRVEISMRTHIGAPSLPCVALGDSVKVRQKIAEVGNGLSLPQHASLQGKVVFVDQDKVIIERQDN